MSHIKTERHQKTLRHTAPLFRIPSWQMLRRLRGMACSVFSISGCYAAQNRCLKSSLGTRLLMPLEKMLSSSALASGTKTQEFLLLLDQEIEKLSHDKKKLGFLVTLGLILSTWIYPTRRRVQPGPDYSTQ